LLLLLFLLVHTAVRYCNAHCLRPQPTSGSVSTTHTAAASAPACDSTPDKMTALDNQAAQSQQSATCHSITPAISCSNLGDLPLDVVSLGTWMTGDSDFHTIYCSACTNYWLLLRCILEDVFPHANARACT